MKFTLLHGALLSAIAFAPGCFFAVRGDADMYATGVPTAVTVSQPPPAQVTVNTQIQGRSAPPSGTAVWIDGYNHWNGTGWIWVEGHYEEPRGGTQWQPGVYANGQYYPGYWRPVNQQPMGPYATPVNSGGSVVVNSNGNSLPVATPVGGSTVVYNNGGPTNTGITTTTTTNGWTPTTNNTVVVSQPTGTGTVTTTTNNGWTPTTNNTVVVSQPTGRTVNTGVNTGGTVVVSGGGTVATTTNVGVTTNGAVGVVTNQTGRPVGGSTVVVTNGAVPVNTGMNTGTVVVNGGTRVVNTGVAVNTNGAQVVTNNSNVVNTNGAVAVQPTNGVVVNSVSGTAATNVAGRPGIGSVGAGVVVNTGGTTGTLQNTNVPARPQCWPNCPPIVVRQPVGPAGAVIVRP